MPPARTGNRSFTAQVTRREAAFVEAERRRRGERFISAIMEEALRDLLAGPGIGAGPLAVPTAAGEELTTVNYRLSPATVDLLRGAKREHGYQLKQIVRASIHALERRVGGGQGPTRNGR